MRLTSPLSCAKCHEIWEPKPPGTLWATPDLLQDSSLTLNLDLAPSVFCLFATFIKRVKEFLSHVLKKFKLLMENGTEDSLKSSPATSSKN